MAEISIEERFFRKFDIGKKRVTWNVYFNSKEQEYSAQCGYENCETQRDAIERIEKMLNEEKRYGEVRVNAVLPVEKYPKIDAERLLQLLLVLVKNRKSKMFDVHAISVEALKNELFEYCLSNSDSKLHDEISKIFIHES